MTTTAAVPVAPEALELLRDCAEALQANATAWIVVQPTLDTPYPDAPHLTPWTRYGEPAARRAYDLKLRVRKYLKANPPPDRPPTVCPVCGKLDHGGDLITSTAHLYGITKDEAKEIWRAVADRLRS